MMGRALTAPDPIEADTAGLWPELVTVPALLTFRERTSILIECYPPAYDEGAPLPIAHITATAGDGAQEWHLSLDLPMLRGLVAALQAAERELVAAGAVAVL